MSETDARTTDGGTIGTTETRGDASTAAERLGGPIEGEQRPWPAEPKPAMIARPTEPPVRVYEGPTWLARLRRMLIATRGSARH